jgi:hypothetical protein
MGQGPLSDQQTIDPGGIVMASRSAVEHHVSGIDLLTGTQDDLENTIRSKVTGIEKVTHVYYLGRNSNPTPVMLSLLRTPSTNPNPSIQSEHTKDIQLELCDAVDHLSPALEFVVLQTGAKMYG